MRTTSRIVLAATGALAAVAMAACGGGTTNAAPPPATTPSFTAQPSAPAAEPSVTDPSTGEHRTTGQAAEQRATTPECRSRDLKLGLIGAGAATSHDFEILTFTNTGSGPCFIVGFPGVSYVAGDDGRQVGAAAVREGSIGPRTTLAHGAVASTAIDSISTGVWDPAKCRPTPVRGFRVYPPDERASLFVPLHSGALGCAGDPGGAQLTVVTIRPGINQPTRN